jgi:radical SAM protein with 4Fe4S-binding SPASM domain
MWLLPATLILKESAMRSTGKKHHYEGNGPVLVRRSQEHEIPKLVIGFCLKQDGRALVIPEPSNRTILLANEIGGKILDLVNGARSTAAICEKLASQFPGVDRSKLCEHVAAFLAKVEAKGIISFVHQPAVSVSAPNPTLAKHAERYAVEPIERRWEYRPDVYWYLTFRCNLACAHCSVLSSPTVDTSGDLKTKDCLEVVEQLAEMHVSKAMLSGGEPLIRPDALTIIRALADRDIHVGLETNGVKVEKEFVDLAGEIQSQHLMHISVSLDGGTAETNSILRGSGSFERTVRGMRLLRKNGVNFDIQCVLHTGNYKTIPKLYDLAVELEPEALHWLPLNSAGRGGDLIKKLGLCRSEIVEVLDLIDRHKRRYQGFNIIKMAPATVPPRYMIQAFKGKDVAYATTCKFPLFGILPNGDITVCAVSRTDRSLQFGNVRTTRLRAAWEEAQMKLLRARYVSAGELRGICGDCVWKSSCKGACRAKAYEEGGDFFAPFPTCQEAADQGEFPDEYRISKTASPSD